MSLEEKKTDSVTDEKDWQYVDIWNVIKQMEVGFNYICPSPRYQL